MNPVGHAVGTMRPSQSIYDENESTSSMSGLKRFNLFSLGAGLGSGILGAICFIAYGILCVAAPAAPPLVFTAVLYTGLALVSLSIGVSTSLFFGALVPALIDKFYKSMSNI